MAALSAFLLALPYIFQLLVGFFSLIGKIGKYAKERNLLNWISEMEASIDQLDVAKTPDEKKQAAGRIGDLIRKLR